MGEVEVEAAKDDDDDEDDGLARISAAPGLRCIELVYRGFTP